MFRINGLGTQLKVNIWKFQVNGGTYCSYFLQNPGYCLYIIMRRELILWQENILMQGIFLQRQGGVGEDVIAECRESDMTAMQSDKTRFASDAL